MGITVADLLTGGLFDFAGKLIEKIWPDPAERDRAKLALLQLQQQGELVRMQADLQLALSQAATNTEEAKGGFFRSGWRPSVGWICSFGLAYQFVVRPLLAWASAAWFHIDVPPLLDIDTLMTLLFGMLGLGTMRSFEKVKSVDKTNP